jgi:hypothetical protein
MLLLNMNTVCCIDVRLMHKHNNDFYLLFYSAALYRLHRNKETILWKALAAVGNSFAARGAELLALTWGDVIRVSDAAGVVSYKIKYQRLKQQTSNSSESEYALLTCVEGVAAFEDYTSCFPQAGRELPEHRAVSTERFSPSIPLHRSYLCLSYSAASGCA